MRMLRRRFLAWSVGAVAGLLIPTAAAAKPRPKPPPVTHIYPSSSIYPSTRLFPG